MLPNTAAAATPNTGVTPDLSHPPRPPKSPILVVLHPDGHVQCYGPPEATMVVAQMPETRSTSAEILAQQLIESQLLATHQKIFAPGHLREIANVKRATVEQLAARKWVAEINSAITRLRRESA